MSIRSASRAAAAVLAIIGFAGTAIILALVLRPDTSVPDSADAVIVFAGGAGERLPAALEVVEREDISTLVVSTGVGDWVGAQARRDLCNAGLGDVEVICFEPVPDDTAGEAAIFTDVLEQHGLDSAIVVTSNYHASRAALRVRQCFSGRVGVQPADSDRTISNITHEFFGILELSIWDRSCHEENRR